MTTLDDHLRKMETCSHLLPEPGGEVARSCIRAIRVLVDERNDWIGCIDDVTEKAKDAIRRRSDAAVLAELDAKETT